MRVSLHVFNVDLRIRCLFILSGLMIFQNFCSGADNPPIRYTFAYNQKYLYLRDVAAYYGMSLNKIPGGCEIRSSYGRISCLYDKREGYLNNVKIHYLFAPTLSGGNSLLSNADFYYVIDPVQRKFALQKQTLNTIVIDPGHGGEDKGASGKLYQEKKLTLLLAKKLKAVLKAKGYNVYLTREFDQTLALEQRPAKCRYYGADLFISIHCNSANNPAISGIETYCLTPEGAPSTSDSKAKWNKERGNAFNKNNFYLAYLIQKNLLQATSAEDRGVRHARFKVLKEAPCPAVLVETGFISNRYEERKLGQPEYEDKIVNGIAKAIVYYANSLLKKY